MEPGEGGEVLGCGGSGVGVWRGGGGELPDEGGEGLRIEAAVAEGDEDGEGVAVEAGLQYVGDLERQIQRLPRLPRRLRVHRPADRVCVRDLLLNRCCNFVFLFLVYKY